MALQYQSLSHDSFLSILLLEHVSIAVAWVLFMHWPWDKDDPEAWKAKYPDFFGKYAQEQTCNSVMANVLINRHWPLPLAIVYF